MSLATFENAPPAYKCSQAYAVPKQPLDFNQAQKLFQDVQNLEKTYRDACIIFNRLNNTLRAKGRSPIQFGAIELTPYSLNGTVTYNKVVFDMQERIVILKARIEEIAFKIVDVELHLERDSYAICA